MQWRSCLSYHPQPIHFLRLLARPECLHRHRTPTRRLPSCRADPKRPCIPCCWHPQERVALADSKRQMLSRRVWCYACREWECMACWGLSDPIYRPGGRRWSAVFLLEAPSVRLTSPLIPPEESRLVWIGLKSSPRMGPVCVELRKINDSERLPNVLDGPIWSPYHHLPCPS